MGLTFKENCPDIRNTRIVDLIKEFEGNHCNVDVYDPWANQEEVLNEYGIKLINYPAKDTYDAILLAVAHDEFNNVNCHDKIILDFCGINDNN